MEAQVDGRRSGSVRAEDGLCEFEKSVAPAVEAFVERAAEVVESIGRFHDAPIMHPPTATRTPYLSAELKRKLRGRANRRVAHVPRDSRKAGQLLRAVALCEKLPAYWRKLLTAF